MLRISLCVLGWVILAAGAARGGSPEAGGERPNAPQAAAELHRLVQQLGSASFHARQRAAAEIRRRGRPAAAALTQALRDPDPEVRWRARSVLRLVQQDAFDAPAGRVHSRCRRNPPARSAGVEAVPRVGRRRPGGPGVVRRDDARGGGVDLGV